MFRINFRMIKSAMMNAIKVKGNVKNILKENVMNG